MCTPYASIWSLFDNIIEDKVASESGIVKLYIALFNELNIKHQMVFTCSREFMRFDKDFEVIDADRNKGAFMQPTLFLNANLCFPSCF